MDGTNKLPEGVNINAEGIITCTREALNRLGDWCRQNAGALAVAVFATTSANAVLAQSLPSNPEYDRIIAEAQRQGKDPVDYALEKGKNEDWASKLDAYIVKKAVIAEDQRNNEKRQAVITKREEGKGLDQAVITKREEGKGLDQELIKKTEIILSIMETRERANKLGLEEIRDLNDMYKATSLPEIRRMIEEKFGRYIRDRKVAQL